MGSPDVTSFLARSDIIAASYWTACDVGFARALQLVAGFAVCLVTGTGAAMLLARASLARISSSVCRALC